MCAAITADRGFTWSDEETALLLELWGANDAQSELTGNKRNFPVYEKISESMIRMGYMRTASQCREKIKRMKREYSLSKQHLDKRCGPKKNMRFFDQFHRILLEKQNRNQRNSSMKPCTSVTDVGKDNISAKRSWDSSNNEHNAISTRLRSQKQSNSEKDDDNPWTPDVLLIEGEENNETLFDNLGSPSVTSVNGESPHDKQRLSEIPFLKCMMDTLAMKLMKYQTESDARILTKIEELENERTATDERIQKMWLNFEEKRRIDEREHELNIMKIFEDIMNQMKEKSLTKK